MSEVDYRRLAHLMAIKAHLEIACDLLQSALMEGRSADERSSEEWAMRENDLIPLRRASVRRIERLITLEWDT